jgi:flavin reductase (DIM6/NTAB) family NADH-FMN oxidoreductase RutF
MADPDPFRRLMGRWATGVSVVTAHAGGADYGLTVNAFLSVSLHPPTLLVSLSHDADTTPVIARGGPVAVNLLAFDQRALSERFAARGPPAEKFASVAFTRGENGAAILRDTLGALEARVVQRFEVADHTLVIGEVGALHLGREVPPLLFYRSQYAASDGGTTLTLPVERPPPKP